MQRLRTEGAIHHGGVLAPFNAFLISRGIATLPLRMEAHSRNAAAVAQWLEHPRQAGAVAKVTFPFAPSHPQHELAREQMQISSGMVSFQVTGGREGAEQTAARMMEHLSTIHYAVSLGQRTSKSKHTHARKHTHTHTHICWRGRRLPPTTLKGPSITSLQAFHPGWHLSLSETHTHTLSL